MHKHYTKEDIMELVQDEDVEFIRLQFTDMFGQMKNVAITVSSERLWITAACSTVLPLKALPGSRRLT